MPPLPLVRLRSGASSLPAKGPALGLALALAAALTVGAPSNGHAQDAGQRALDALKAADALIEGQGESKRKFTSAVPNYRDALRDIIATLSIYAKGRDATFQIATREGLGLVVKGRRDAAIETLIDPTAAEKRRAVSPVGSPVRRYARHLDGVVMNDQYCVARKADMTASEAFVTMLQEQSLVVLSVDHCASPEAAADAWRVARAAKVVAHADSLAADGPDAVQEGLQRVPVGRPFGENPDNVTRLSEARNILVLDGSAGYADKADLILDLTATNYDILALSPFHRHGDPLTAAQVHQLRYKKLGARRLVLARLNIAQARDTAYYWKDAWRVGKPDWIRAPVPEEPGLYDVNFWHQDWRAILGRTFAGLMDLGFDGVVLEGTEAYKPLEELTPID